MVALADLPFVMPLAEWIWGADTSADVTPEICVSQVPLISIGCLSQLITKALGVGIIFGSCLNKTPIMINIMNSQSDSGISLSSIYGEAIVYSNGAVYGFLEGHPFTAYGENGALLVQNIIIVFLAWNYAKKPVTIPEKAMVLFAFLAYLVVTLTMLPKSLRYLLMTSIWPVLLYARGSQVLATFQAKHTGNLSIVTTGMNLAGGMARIGTTLKETGDSTVLAGFILSVGLNFIMFCQYWIYLKNTLKIAKELKQEKESKKKS